MYIVKAPILFLVYKRLDTARHVFEAIARARPERLYIAGDGPRRERDGEAAAVAGVREWLLAHIDWPCEVHTLFREENLGCKTAVSSALTWFFASEEKGIVLEDDCVPAESFFRFCDELLDKYKDVPEVVSISGHNYLDDVSSYYPESYHFSKYFHCWGWATWRRVIEAFDKDITRHHPRQRKPIIHGSNETWQERSYWSRIWKNVAQGTIDSWAYPMIFNVWKERGLSCIPVKNLVGNVGTGVHATHTRHLEIGSFSTHTYELDGPIIHPAALVANKGLDDSVARNAYKITLPGSLLSALKARIPFKKQLKKLV